jgi:RHS repeat-associated protein
VGASRHPLEHTDNSGNRQYYELDLAGNVRRLRAPGGADLGGYRYTAFGGSITDATAPTAPTGVNALPVRWKGRWLMYSTGSGAGLVELYDMRARWWWPQGGVFVSVDYFGYHDDRSTLWGWPGQNPLAWSDPTGHDGILDAIGTLIASFVEPFSGNVNTPANFSNTAPMISVQTSSIGSNGVDSGNVNTPANFSNTAPMISVQTSSIGSNGVDLGIPLHSSIITSDGEGVVSAFRGEPVSVVGEPDELGASRRSHRPDSDPDWDHDARANVIATGSLAARKLNCIANEIKRIDAEQNDYAACGGPNSNTAVATALANCGIPADQALGYLPGFLARLMKKRAIVFSLIGGGLLIAASGAYIGRPKDNALCRRSATLEEFRSAILAEGVVGLCNLELVRQRLAKLGIQTAAYPNGDMLDAITQCPGGFFRRRGFTLDLRLKNGCVDDVHVERHDTGP